MVTNVDQDTLVEKSLEGEIVAVHLETFGQLIVI